jgi:hypothetical protein
MTRFDESWSGRLRIVGDLERPDHWYLRPDDTCYFFGEYTARGGYGHSSTNQIIHNLKKKPELAGKPQYHYKARDIQAVGTAIRSNLNSEMLNQVSIVPMPPSKPSGALGYDDRMAQIAHAVGGVDVREAIVTTVDRPPMHTTDSHRNPATLRNTLATVPALLGNPKPLVILLDDVLTTGCTFTVCKALLQEVWPETQIMGLFIARRVIDRSASLETFIEIEL